MAAAPSGEEIMDAVRASGFLMEQEVATRIEDMGFHVQTGRAFEDSEEGKSREIDVWATKRFIHDEEAKLAAYVELIIECKNSSNPYVFLTRRKNERDELYQPNEFRFPVQYYVRQKKLDGGKVQTSHRTPFSELGLKEAHPFFKWDRKAVQFCRIDRAGKSWSANHGGLYDAMFIPLLKALKSRIADTQPRSLGAEWKFAWAFFPVIVVRGTLLEIDSMADKPEPREVSVVPFVRDMKSKAIRGPHLVYFVNENHLAEFINESVQPLVDQFASHPAGQILTTTREWTDADN